MKDGVIFQGPKITWERDEVKKAVGHYGYNEACRIIAGNTLQIEYVKEKVKWLVGTPGDAHEYDTSLHGEGTV